MAHYTVKMSDGRTAEFDHPNAGLSKDEVQNIISSKMGGGQQTQSFEQPTYWKDVISNASQEASAMAKGALTGASNLLGATDPIQYAKSAGQAWRGTPIGQTDVAQNIKGAMQVPAGLISGLIGTAKTAGKTVASPFQMASGTPLSQTMIGQQFREKPVGTALDFASLIPVIKGIRGANIPSAMGSAVESGGNALERAGIRGMNQTIGIRPQTIEEMAPSGANPGKFGIDFGRTLKKEGAMATNPTQAFENVKRLADQSGKAVENSLKAIKDQNRWFSGYPNMADPLKQSANKILKPLLDEANQFNKSQYPLERFQGKYHRAAYESLAEKANKNNGFLTLDDIRSEMQRVGKMMGAASEDHYKVLSKVYRRLADTRNTMVQDIAKSFDRPELASNLLKANEQYHRYISILPDVERAAAKSSVGTPSLSLHQAILKKIEPYVSEGMYKVGSMFGKNQ